MAGDLTSLGDRCTREAKKAAKALVVRTNRKASAKDQRLKVTPATGACTV